MRLSSCTSLSFALAIGGMLKAMVSIHSNGVLAKYQQSQTSADVYSSNQKFLLNQMSNLLYFWCCFPLPLPVFLYWQLESPMDCTDKFIHDGWWKGTKHILEQ